jgi:hypothetical protein
LALLYRDHQHRYADAETQFREVLDIYRNATPVNHYELAKSLLYLGNIYRQSAAEYRLAFPQDDGVAATAELEHGVVLLELDRLAEAERLMLASESVMRKNTSWRVYSAAAVACLYAKWDQAEPGKGYDAKVREWSSKILDAYWPDAGVNDSRVKAKP